MLVIVSDFHFSDGTAVPANWNVNPRGIELLLRDVYRQATRKGVKELYLVLLGDIFDTLRSEVWPISGATFSAGRAAVTASA